MFIFSELNQTANQTQPLLRNITATKHNVSLTGRLRARLIRKLRAHGLVAKVPRSRLYRVTTSGYHLMSTAVRYRLDLFPSQLLAAA